MVGWSWGRLLPDVAGVLGSAAAATEAGTEGTHTHTHTCGAGFDGTTLGCADIQLAASSVSSLCQWRLPLVERKERSGPNRGMDAAHRDAIGPPLFLIISLSEPCAD